MNKNKLKQELNIVSLGEIHFAGCVRRISGKELDRPARQKAMWEELEEDGTLARIREYASGAIEGTVAVSCNFNSKGFDQFIGVSTEAQPEEFKKFSLPAGEYAVFECAEGQSTDELWRSIYFDLVPRSEYLHTGGAELEVRGSGPVRIYVPVKKRQQADGRRPATSMVMTFLWMAVGLFVGLILSSGKQDRILYIALGLIIGGAVGYIIDKLKRASMDAADKKARERDALEKAESDTHDLQD